MPLDGSGDYEREVIEPVGALRMVMETRDRPRRLHAHERDVKQLGMQVLSQTPPTRA